MNSIKQLAQITTPELIKKTLLTLAQESSSLAHFIEELEPDKTFFKDYKEKSLTTILGSLALLDADDFNAIFFKNFTSIQLPEPTLAAIYLNQQQNEQFKQYYDQFNDHLSGDNKSLYTKLCTLARKEPAKCIELMTTHKEKIYQHFAKAKPNSKNAVHLLELFAELVGSTGLEKTDKSFLQIGVDILELCCNAEISFRSAYIKNNSAMISFKQLNSSDFLYLVDRAKKTNKTHEPTRTFTNLYGFAGYTLMLQQYRSGDNQNNFELFLQTTHHFIPEILKLNEIQPEPTILGMVKQFIELTNNGTRRVLYDKRTNTQLVEPNLKNSKSTTNDFTYIQNNALGAHVKIKKPEFVELLLKTAQTIDLKNLAQTNNTPSGKTKLKL